LVQPANALLLLLLLLVPGYCCYRPCCIRGCNMMQRAYATTTTLEIVLHMQT
jgi:hypothetical protein